MGKLACACAVVIGFVLSTASSASATPVEGESRKEAIDWRGIYKAPAATQGVEVSPLFGYASNSLGVGAGLRAGYTFKEGAYVGGAFMYHHGIDSLPGDATARVSMLYPAAEVGYDFRYESVSFRPYAGAGMAAFHYSTPLASGFSDPYFIVYPGISITARPDGSMFFAGLDARLAMPFVEKAELTDVMSLGVYATAGLHF
jgi:opacity protein-like surface antigen